MIAHFPGEDGMTKHNRLETKPTLFRTCKMSHIMLKRKSTNPLMLSVEHFEINFSVWYYTKENHTKFLVWHSFLSFDYIFCSRENFLSNSWKIQCMGNAVKNLLIKAIKMIKGTFCVKKNAHRKKKKVIKICLLKEVKVFRKCFIHW